VRRVLVIGIGVGDPDHVTIQAVKAMNRADVFFFVDKGPATSDLVRLRRDVLERYAEQPYRLIEAHDPDRDRTASAYSSAVDAWRRRRADIYERLIADELADDECGAFLVWGDPTLYDSTIGILETILDEGRVEFDYEVIPGISSISALAARHRVALNRVGRPIQITTGRQLAEGFPEGVDDVVVMLDAREAFKGFDEPDLEIFWGAYVGTPDEILMSGPIAAAAERIRRRRAEARQRKGWIMDTYLLRRRQGPGRGPDDD
jgi:precorrin-6A synthase